MRFMFLIVYLLMSAVSSFSNGYDVESIPEMFAKEVIRAMCQHLLKEYQLQDGNNPFINLCRQVPEAFFRAQEGFQRGIKHCRDNFKCHRWNCTTHKDHMFKLFGVGMARASRESSIMIAMATAGMVEHVTNELGKGIREKHKVTMNDCMNSRQPRNPKEYVAYSDCNADVSQGEHYARLVIQAFLEHHKISQDEIKMNEHNANVGSIAVRVNMRRKCKCVGLSGVCNSKFCFKILRHLKVSTDWLRERYNKAKKVQASHRPKRDGTRPLVTVEGYSAPTKDDLIYLLDSPNYCKFNKSTGSLGTKGRLCNVCSDKGLGSCEEMCCGRGYSKHEISELVSCQCSFKHKIIKIECKTCRRNVTQYRCK